ncbi:Tetraspanin-33 [Fragariocoptes setiger]|uniref:Tetraspanin-33 n=1 Tax=Fragariocoptes setiger TaxID=1670756 RepID=A0ABQ7S734_9ACAR|nr:Tetraspanin-33 [Fragariocoptes setiger]
MPRLIGIIMVGLGGWSFSEEILEVGLTRLPRASNVLHLVLHVSFAMMFVGGITFFMSFAGCLGALRENICLLKLYSFMLLFLFIGEVIVSTVAFVFPNAFIHYFKEGLSKDLVMKYRDDANLQNLIDTMHTGLKCCGVSDKGYKDWSQNIYFNCSVANPSPERCGVPYSCCRSARDLDSGLINVMCGNSIQNTSSVVEVNKYIYTRGCIEAFTEVFEKNMYTAAMLMEPHVVLSKYSLPCLLISLIFGFDQAGGVCQFGPDIVTTTEELSKALIECRLRPVNKDTSMYKTADELYEAIRNVVFPPPKDPCHPDHIDKLIGIHRQVSSTESSYREFKFLHRYTLAMSKICNSNLYANLIEAETKFINQPLPVDQVADNDKLIATKFAAMLGEDFMTKIDEASKSNQIEDVLKIIGVKRQFTFKLRMSYDLKKSVDKKITACKQYGQYYENIIMSVAKLFAINYGWPQESLLFAQANQTHAATKMAELSDTDRDTLKKWLRIVKLCEFYLGSDIDYSDFSGRLDFQSIKLEGENSLEKPIEPTTVVTFARNIASVSDYEETLAQVGMTDEFAIVNDSTDDGDTFSVDSSLNGQHNNTALIQVGETFKQWISYKSNKYRRNVKLSAKTTVVAACIAAIFSEGVRDISGLDNMSLDKIANSVDKMSHNNTTTTLSVLASCAALVGLLGQVLAFVNELNCGVPHRAPQRSDRQRFANRRFRSHSSPELSDGASRLIDPPYEAVSGNFPWHVYLFSDSGSICHGSILNKKYVLTAAHCVQNDSVFPMDVVYGTTDPPIGKRITKQKITSSKCVRKGEREYVQVERQNVRWLANFKDYAVIQLPEAIRWNNEARPICLPIPDQYFGDKDSCLVHTLAQFNDPDGQNVERDAKYCKAIRDVGNFCAKPIQRGHRPISAPCFGDSGAAFICKDDHGRFVQFGIVYGGDRGCTREGGLFEGTAGVTDLSWHRKSLDLLIDELEADPKCNPGPTKKPHDELYAL